MSKFEVLSKEETRDEEDGVIHVSNFSNELIEVEKELKKFNEELRRMHDQLLFIIQSKGFLLTLPVDALRQKSLLFLKK